ncbi:hypothetical protein ACWKW6_31775 [Dyadobacter jiangsuensis]
MEKIKFGIFDVFVYITPGLFALLCIYLCYADLGNGCYQFSIKFIALVDKVSLNLALVIIIIAYILGFSIHQFGYNYFYLAGKLLFKKNFLGYERGLSTEERKFILVRHFSKENFTYVELWNSFRGMSFNLSLVFLMIAIIIVVRLVANSSFGFDWGVVVAFFLLLSLITLRRAVTFHIWSHRTLKETVETLRLAQKAINVDGAEPK